MKPIYKTASTVTAIGALLALGGCVSVPTGPSVMAMPGKDKTYEQFRADQCQHGTDGGHGRGGFVEGVHDVSFIGDRRNT